MGWFDPPTTWRDERADFDREQDRIDRLAEHGSVTPEQVRRHEARAQMDLYPESERNVHAELKRDAA